MKLSYNIITIIINTNNVIIIIIIIIVVVIIIIIIIIIVLLLLYAPRLRRGVGASGEGADAGARAAFYSKGFPSVVRDYIL